MVCTFCISQVDRSGSTQGMAVIGHSHGAFQRIIRSEKPISASIGGRTRTGCRLKIGREFVVCAGHAHVARAQVGTSHREATRPRATRVVVIDVDRSRQCRQR